MIPVKEQFTVRLPPKLLAALREEADLQERRASELIREAVQEYLKKRGSTR